MPTETWLPAVGFEQRFLVSDHGQIWSLIRKRPLRPYLMSGYPAIELTRKPKRTERRVHLLVLEAFVGPRPPGLYGLHKDDVRTHNHVENLYWGTLRQNQADCVANGKHANTKKEFCPWSHQLVEPNLVQSVARQGERSCLACHRAHSVRRARARRAQPPINVRAYADEVYAALMRGESARSFRRDATTGQFLSLQ